MCAICGKCCAIMKFEKYLTEKLGNLEEKTRNAVIRIPALWITYSGLTSNRLTNSRTRHCERQNNSCFFSSIFLLLEYKTNW